MGDPRDEPAAAAGREAYRHQPYDIDVEQALLGAILIDENAYWRLEGSIEPETFYDPLHQRIFETLQERFKRRMGATPLSVHVAMKTDPGLIEVGGPAYLAGLAQAAPALPNVKDLARILRDAAQRRQLIRIGEDLVNRAYEPAEAAGAETIIEETSEALFDLTRQAQTGRGAIAIKDLAMEAVLKAEHAMNNPAEVCLTSGLRTVDEHLGGLYRSDLLILAGAPNMGKSAFEQMMALANASGQRFGESRLTAEEAKEREGLFCLLFSLEMADWQLGMRHLADATSIPSSLMRRGTVQFADIEKMMKAQMDMPNLPLKVDGGRKLSVAQIRARAHAAQRRSNGKLAKIGIDHLRFIRPANPRLDERDQIQQITSDLKDLAVELNVHITLLAHLNREYNKRASKRPINSDLYGAAAIEQNADAIWFLHSEAYFLERDEPPASDPKGRQEWIVNSEREKGWMEVFSTKARMDKVGKARVRFEPAFTRFSDPEEAMAQRAAPADLLTRVSDPLDNMGADPRPEPPPP